MADLLRGDDSGGYSRIELDPATAARWASAAGEVVQPEVGAPPTRRRVRASASTPAGWALGLSPLALAVALIAWAVATEYFTVAGLIATWAVATLLAAGLAAHDRTELRRRGFPVTAPLALVIATPLPYLVIRARQTRDDFTSYRLVWLFAGGVVAGLLLMRFAVLAASFVIGTRF